jgi:DNA-binding NtrC family response regulator/predicted hydrocarbon binding protein
MITIPCDISDCDQQEGDVQLPSFSCLTLARERQDSNMKLHNLQLLELLDIRPEQGTIYLKGQRMLVQRAAALGHLRKELIGTFGIETTRRLFLRYGYAHGYEDGLSLERRFGVKSAVEAIEIGCTFHTIQGIVLVEPLRMDDVSSGVYHVESILRNSFEAEEHLRHHGKSDGPVCWSITGYASGYASAIMHKDVYYRESMCFARGDPHCRVEGRDSDSWGAELASVQRDYQGAETCEISGIAALRAELDRLRTVASDQEVKLLRYEQKLAGREAEADDLRANVLGRQSERFIVRSTAVSEAIEQAIRVSPLNNTVLICGETGTGKEFFVRLIHQQSPRSAEPFVSVNCAALTETLLESELFGHVRGAFTGAVRDKMGLFELARGGTLFLDEIGEMPHSVQAKLLRALENGEVRRVGGDRNIKINARIIAATNRDLRAAVQAGTFRQDLYYRLAGFVISLPPLRKRREDIPPLVHEFLRRSAKNLDRDVPAISPEAMSCLLRYPWPGNVRELIHAMERAIIVANNSVIDVGQLPGEITASPGIPESDTLDLKQRERNAIAQALQQYGGNHVDAARALNISPVTLWRKLKRYGITADNTKLQTEM